VNYIAVIFLAVFLVIYGKVISYIWVS